MIQNIMNKILSFVLIISLLTGSVSPAFAQLRPVSKGVRAVSRGSKAVQVGRVLPQTVRPDAYVLGTKAPFLPQTIAPSFSASHIQSVVSNQAASVQLGMRFSAIQIKQLTQSGKLNGIASAILNLPADSPHKLALLRNEFVTAALMGQASREQISQAVKFYRKDLIQRAPLLAEMKGRDTAAFLSQTSAETLKIYQEIVSSAGALATLGNKEDAGTLLDFWQQTQGGPLEEVATNITGRGLLRFKAYADFNLWANSILPKGEVWLGFDAYATANELPIAFPMENLYAVPILPKKEMGAWLKEGCAVNMLNVEFSPSVTEAWVNLGKDPKFLAYVLHFSEKPSVSLPQVPAQAPVAGQAEQMTKLPPLQIEIPALPLGQLEDLTLRPVKLGGSSSGAVEALSAPVSVGAATSFTSRAAVDNSGMLYGGFPLFALSKRISQLGGRIRSWGLFNKHTRSNLALNEEPGLHDNTVEEVFAVAEEQNVADPDDLIDVENQEASVFVGEHGFKLTVEGADGTEHILHNVDVGIDAPIKTEGYNRLVLSNGHIFQLRNSLQQPNNLEHFFFELPHQKGELWQLLAERPANLNLSRPLRIKLEHMPNRRYDITPLRASVEGSTDAVPVIADVESSLLPEQKEGTIRIKRDGTVHFISASGEPFLMKDFYVRLPKEESRFWARLMQNQPQSNFVLQIHPTVKKTKVLTMNVPLLQIGLGKTLSPELKARTTLGEVTSSSIMLGINNVLPVLMGFVHPLLRRYGEAAVLRWGTGFFAAGGAVALGSGLYGFLGDGVMSSWQLGGFLTSSILIAMGTNISRFVQNLLITANRGKIVPKDSFSAKAEDGDSQTSAPVYNFQYLRQRTKQVLTQKPSSSARDVVLFQTGQMFKNIGTMAFLAFPWLANATAGLFGVNLGLDFSASYVPYAAFSAWTSYKLSRTAFKDAVPMNISAVENKFQETLAEVVNNLKMKPRQQLRAGQQDMLDAAKKLKSSIEVLARVESRYKKVPFEKVLVQREEECVEALRTELLKHGRSTSNANGAAEALAGAFESLGRRDVRLGQVLRAPKVFPATLGMTLATMHELSVSNGFAFTMHNLLPNGAYANALTALVLYGSMSTGRLLGNWISRRISGGSMYALSSAFSLLGTATMVAAGGNVPTLMTGAVIASFGVGNFFSQMYEYMTGLYPKFRREISLIINYTMPAAAVLAMPMRKLVGATGFAGMDLLVSGVGLLGSLALTSGMFANSSIVKAGKHGLGQLKQYVKHVFSRSGKNPPPADLGSAAPAQ